MVVEIHVGIGEVDRQQRVVVAQVGPEQQRLHAVEQQLEMREETVSQLNSPSVPPADARYRRGCRARRRCYRV